MTLLDVEHYDLSARFKYLLDDSNAQTIKDVLSLDSSAWTHSTQNNTSFGYNPGSYWFTVSLDVQQADTWYVWLRYALHDQVVFYWVKDGAIIETITTGDQQPYQQRDVKIPDFAFSRYLEKGEQVDFYLRLKTQGSYKVPLEIWSQSGFEGMSSSQIAFQSFYYGVLFVMSVYNLVLFFITRIRSYLYYVFYVFTSLITRLSVDGTGFQFLWGQSPSFNTWAIPLTFWLGVMSFWLFSYSFLNFKKSTIKIKTYFLAVGFISLVSGLGILTMPYNEYVPLITLMAMFLLFSSLLSSIFLTFKGHRYAGVFAIATMMSVLAFAFSVFDSLGFFDSQTLMIYSYPVARMFEIVLFAIALGVRIRFLDNRRLKAEKKTMALREETIENIKQYERLYQNAMTGNFVLELGGEIKNGNGAFYDMVGGSKYHKSNIQQFFKKYSDSIFDEVKEKSLFSAHNDMQCRNGKWFSILLNKVVHDTGDYIEGSMVDISDRIHAEKLQQQAQQDKMQALQQLVVGVAHEMNTPLGVVRTSSDFARVTLSKLSGGIDKSKLTKGDFKTMVHSSSEALEIADVNIERMADLVENFKRVSVEQMSYQTEPLNIIGIYKRLEQQAQLEGLLLSLKFDDNCNVPFVTFSQSISRVLNELIDNVRAHVDGNPKVFIESVQTNTELKLHIYDLGKGVIEDDLKHIFEPFFTTKRGSQKKLGLGLYRVHNIVCQLLNGKIKAYNQSGLHFEIIIPNPDCTIDH